MSDAQAGSLIIGGWITVMWLLVAAGCYALFMLSAVWVRHMMEVWRP